MKKQAKEIFFNNIEFTLSDTNASNPRQYWKIIKMLVKDNSSKCEPIPPLLNESNGTFSFTDIEKANTLNNYFSSVSNIDDSLASLPYFSSKTNKRLYNIFVTEQDTIDILSNLNVNKANGPDEISHRMLKETRNTICVPLTIIFKRSLQETVYPVSWKDSHVMPLFKKGDKNTVSNYRPISLISCVGKVMERVVFKYLYNYMHINNLIYQKQSGFLPGHSTVFQLIDLYNQICSAFDERKSTCIIFCDISKAFDRVWHSGLIFKLKQYGIEGNVLNWISCYLKNRSQKCFVGSSFSDKKVIKAGVPQGSVLGPLFFLIYVNDITYSLLSISRLYADDSSLAVSSNNIDYIERTLNHDLLLISKWAERWLVNFNPSKTEVMFLTLAKNVNIKPYLTFNNIQLDYVKNHKHLGVTLSDDGTWHAHISNIASSASKVLGTMKLLKFKLKRVTLNQIYISYLRPILEYASILWDNCTMSEKDLIEKIQYDSARAVTGLTRSVSLNKLINEIGWVSLSDRRKMQKLILIFKYKNGDLPSYLNDIMPDTVRDTNIYNLRNQLDYATVARRLEIFSKSVIPSSIKLWNDLDIDTRNSNSLFSFKRKLKNLFKPPIVPSYFYIGDRFLQIHHTRIRNSCSSLNNDLFTNHLRESPQCNCGYHCEDAEHFFFRCLLYHNQRLQFFTDTRTYHPLSCQKLLFGIEGLSTEENSDLFKKVQLYIKQTRRFETRNA